ALSLDSYVTSSYNSLQVKGTKHTARGMSLLGAYTWAKSIDLSSERGSGDRGGGFDTGGGSGPDRRGRCVRPFAVPVRAPGAARCRWAASAGAEFGVRITDRAREKPPRPIAGRMGNFGDRAFPERIPDYCHDVGGCERRRNCRPSGCDCAGAVQHAQPELLH